MLLPCLFKFLAVVVVVLVIFVLRGASSRMGRMGVIKYGRWCVALFRAGEMLFLKFNRSVSLEKEAQRSYIAFYFIYYSSST